MGDTMKLSAGAAVSHGFAILLSPILARLYAPAAFGVASLFAAILTVVESVSCLRYELAIMLPKKDHNALSLLLGSLFFVCLFSVLTTLGVYFLGGPICRLLKAPSLAVLLWLLPVAVLLSGFGMALRYWHTRLGGYGLVAGAQVAAAATQGAGRLGAGLLGHVGAGSLVLTKVVGLVVSAAGLAWGASRYGICLFRQAPYRRTWRLLGRYRKFPLASTWSALLNSVSAQVPIFLLAALFSEAVVGYYFLARHIVTLPLLLIGRAVAQVFFQRASAARIEGALAPVVRGTHERLVSLGLLPTIVLAFIGPEMFRLVFGWYWEEAGIYAQILSLWCFCKFVCSPMSMLWVVLERQGLGLVFNVGLVVSRLASLLIGGWMNDVHVALALYAGSGVVLWGMLILYLLRLAGVSGRHAVSPVLRCLVYASPTILCLAGAVWWGLPAWIKLALAGVGALSYYGMVIHGDVKLRSSLFAVLAGVLRRA